jgi:transcriptional regulator with XRE-family HTH domain
MEPDLIGDALSQARREIGLTQAQVARRMGTTQTAVARAESGAILPSWTWLERYATALGRTIDVWVSVGSRRVTPPETPVRYEPEDVAQAKRRARRAALGRARLRMERDLR